MIDRMLDIKLKIKNRLIITKITDKCWKIIEITDFIILWETKIIMLDHSPKKIIIVASEINKL